MIERRVIFIDISKQLLTVFDKQHRVVTRYSISSSVKGLGEQKDSNQTPRGLHIIRAKIGENLPIYSVFVARRPTGEIFSEKLRAQFPNRDWILTRILWLSGLEIGVNRLGTVDTMQRFIYIHGTADEDKIGVPNSHGCIRMRNHDVIDLFDRVDVNELVMIQEHA